MTRPLSKAFTLIELLIVVAIIAILAAIAVPNFLEAQTRAKVSRVKSDMRSVSIALEAYQLDYNKYPFDGVDYNGSVAGRTYNYWYLPADLSTPVAYITSVKFPDPFRGQISPSAPGGTGYQTGDFRYSCVASTWGDSYQKIQNPPGASVYFSAMVLEWGGWRLMSSGPDRNMFGGTAAGGTGPSGGWPGLSSLPPNNYPVTALPMPYDATNGTVSIGEIIRSQRSSTGYVNAQ